ncbi:ATP phosphoribosyltransferase regulatory subunit [Leptospira bandrabouensis]|uniref:ATP phosphoribosyltransferase regulatory subunit n=1 Tax=Leptospira bandrabouensis TaxID=2484903 RepID=A0A6H3NTF9_9LEPT|nr:ATP phosphoribosyltransferase regulatory subunit [Leptospira bandrabouensis]MCG6144840.1 ATP phosphoribosyltransferase regulatory subunit [Leptospira bandrabouensis]MCG6152855.1 ATP phosphoribosyltransferase regulatory subunit [Leptospira bandrabouensis]MCG6160523.1 ATP phosphoribosyltransferase regulatory subunit [Leptospira bandrabouensis]MCG6164455.1 ATP phosphoribosyltransferase regulatory subunit [Leptospira bandrabouensis]MCW7459015.1 ATP phosphoribosyltransferase regulatory subunit [
MNQKNKSISSEQKWIPDGFHFLGPEESKNRRNLLQSFSELFEREGYSEISLPSFDYSNSFRSHLDHGLESLLVTKDWDGNELSPGVDLTLQVVKGMAARSHWEENQNVFYFARKIRDHKKRNASRREILQVGVESLGKSDTNHIISQIKILHQLWKASVPSEPFTIVFGHSSFFRSVLEILGWNEEQTKVLRQFLYTKNLPELVSLAARENTSEPHMEMIQLLLRPIPVSEMPKFQNSLQKILSPKEWDTLKGDLESITSFFAEWSKVLGEIPCIWDPSLVRDLSYYTGFMFQGYVERDPEPVFAGGVYNELYESFTGIKKDACGFALHLDSIEEIVNKVK